MRNLWQRSKKYREAGNRTFRFRFDWYSSSHLEVILIGVHRIHQKRLHNSNIHKSCILMGQRIDWLSRCKLRCYLSLIWYQDLLHSQCFNKLSTINKNSYCDAHSQKVYNCLLDLDTFGFACLTAVGICTRVHLCLVTRQVGHTLLLLSSCNYEPRSRHRTLSTHNKSQRKIDCCIRIERLLSLLSLLCLKRSQS